MALLRFAHAFLKGNADFQIIDDALARITDPFWRDELASRRLFVTSISSGPREAVLEAVSTTWTTRPDPASRAAITHASILMGRLDDAIEELAPPPGTRAFPAPDHPWHQWLLFGNDALALIYAGRLVEADELLAMAYGQLMDHPAAEARGFVARWSAVLHLEQGRPLSAFRRASESYTLFQQLGGSSLAPRGYMYAAHALAMAGRAEQAATTLAALDTLGVPILPIEGAELLRARGWAAAAAGDLPSARSHLEEAADLAEEIGHLVGAASALHDLGRLGQARQVAGRLEDLAAQVDGDLVAARATYGTAVAARDGKALHEVSEALERLGAILYAAEASVEAAAASRRVGRPRDAAADEHRAAQLLSHCEGAITPVVSTISARARLTPGELDAAVQAAAGRPNRQIAADGHISVRTVESHLQRVYEKLGISSRRDLADALRDQPGT